MTARAAWPSGQNEAFPTDDDYAEEQALPVQALPDQGPAHAVIGDMADLLRDTRGNLMAAGGLLGAITIGIAMEAGPSARALRPGVAGVINLGLFGGLLLCWLTALGLLMRASRPVLSMVSELRWRTGAPLDPRARWLTLPPVGDCAGEWSWARAHLMLGAARLARYRLRLADTWTYLTAACFLAWTAVVILGL
jgi:hypothetical protein